MFIKICLIYPVVAAKPVITEVAVAVLPMPINFKVVIYPSSLTRVSISLIEVSIT